MNFDLLDVLSKERIEMTKTKWIVLILLMFVGLSGCSQKPTSAGAATARQSSNVSGASESRPQARGFNFAGLSAHVWQVSQSPSPAPKGSLYIFLPDGALLETSCVETYRIARWSSPSDGMVQVVEDKELAFDATVLQIDDSTLRLEKTLRRGEKQTVTLTAVSGEFVCPDLPK
jgi:hypothetical protein